MYGATLDRLFDRLSVRTIALSCAAVAVAYSALAITIHGASAYSYVNSVWSITDPVYDRSVITLSPVDVPATMGAPLSIDDVQSQQQLVSYAQGMMHDDPRITQVAITDHAVSMTYQESSRLLGVKKVASQVTATMSDSGSISLSKPWYSSLSASIANADAPDIGFSDLKLERDSSGIMPQSAARVLARMHGRFQIGALK